MVLAIQPTDLSRLGQVSVVGGAGFIGLNLCRHLARSGASVTAIDPNPLRREAIEGFDIRHERSLTRQAVEGSSVVFHVAGSTEPASSSVAVSIWAYWIMPPLAMSSFKKVKSIPLLLAVRSLST